MKRFQDRVALVTGGPSGIGKATALAFAAEGARVVVAGRRETEGTAVVADIRRHGGQATFVATDVTRDADVRKLVDSALRSYGRLDVAVQQCRNRRSRGSHHRTRRGGLDAPSTRTSRGRGSR